jgi:hypothetical protein
MAVVATNATPEVATAERSSVRIRVATGSAVEGSSASMSVISRTPPPSRTVSTAAETLRSRSSACSAPTSGPSSSTSLRSAHTTRTIVALPTPAGPDTSTPRLAAAPRVCSSSGSSSESLSHSVSRLTWLCTPLRSSALTDGRCDGVVTVAWPTLLSTPALPRSDTDTVPSPQLTTELGCTLTGPAGSTPVTVSSSEVQVMPTDEASAEVAAEVEVPGPRSRGSSDTVSPTVITLPSSAWRRVADEIDWVASLEPDTVTDRAPYTVTGATITVLVSRRPALDNVTSSSRAVPVGVPGGATPTTAAVVLAPVRATASHSRRPSAAMASGCNRTTPRRLSSAEVFSRAVSRRWVSA